jgi:hypothetical protein
MTVDRRTLIALAIGYLAAAYAPAHAVDASIDRALVERLVRAVESLAHATERCNR